MIDMSDRLQACRAALASFADKHVMVIGDLMIDEHIWGRAERISPEAPVMVVQVDSPESDCRPGGAANVANNIRAFGARASVVGVVGDDEGGRMLVRSLEEAGVDTSGVFVDKSRPTTRKTRIWASHRHQVVRVDWESKRKISAGLAKRIIEHIESKTPDVDCMLISDYDKGVVTRDTAGASIGAAERAGKVSATNAKPRNVGCFSGVGVMTLNQSEACAASGIDIESAADAEKAAAKLMATAHCGSLVITRGANGLSVFEPEKQPCHIPALETEVYDVAGAGDTVISALVLALSCGVDFASAGIIANCAGGAVVRKVGVATTDVREVDELLQTARLRQGM